MSRSDLKTLVSTDWLADQLGEPDLRVLDASWYLPAQNRDPKAEFAEAHIPGARFFDTVSYTHLTLPTILLV